MVAARDPQSPGEAEFLADYDPSQFERPSVAVDVTLLTVRDGRLSTWLLQRKQHPHRGAWSLPGGFVGMDESLLGAAKRVLESKTGVVDVFLEQLFTFGHPARDPRTRIISVAHFALVAIEELEALAAERDDVELFDLEIPWEGQTGGAVDVVDAAGRPQRLAFDHPEQIGMAVKRIRGKLAYSPIGFQLLPHTFTMRGLQAIHEAVLGQPINKDSFRRRMLASGDLQSTGEYETQVGHRPAELYEFARRAAV